MICAWGKQYKKCAYSLLVGKDVAPFPENISLCRSLLITQFKQTSATMKSTFFLTLVAGFASSAVDGFNHVQKEARRPQPVYEIETVQPSLHLDKVNLKQVPASSVLSSRQSTAGDFYECRNSVRPSPLVPLFLTIRCHLQKTTSKLKSSIHPSRLTYAHSFTNISSLVHRTPHLVTATATT